MWVSIDRPDWCGAGPTLLGGAPAYDAVRRPSQGRAGAFIALWGSIFHRAWSSKLCGPPFNDEFQDSPFAPPFDLDLSLAEYRKTSNVFPLHPPPSPSSCDAWCPSLEPIHPPSQSHHRTRPTPTNDNSAKMFSTLGRSTAGQSTFGGATNAFGQSLANQNVRMDSAGGPRQQRRNRSPALLTSI